MKLRQLFESKNFPLPSKEEVAKKYRIALAWSQEQYDTSETMNTEFANYTITVAAFNGLSKLFNVETGELYLPVVAYFKHPSSIHPDQTKPQYISVTRDNVCEYHHAPPIWKFYLSKEGKGAKTLADMHDDPEVMKKELEDAEKRYYAKTPWKLLD